MKNTLLFLFAMLTCLPAFGAEDMHTSDREALKKILYDIEGSFNNSDIEAVFKHLDDRAVLTFMTTNVASGKKEIMAYYKRMFQGENAPLKSYKTKSISVEPAIFHNDTMVAHGKIQDTFELANGTERQFDTQWTATGMKKDGVWKVLSIHYSVNPLDNTVLDTTKEMVMKYSIGAFFAGALISWVLLRVFSSKRES